ncbi:tRNA pseudouridine38-40 synthase [Angomonas deanei]|uniref:tRNA pseudouridine synthase, putative n=1 Tax=Angomonas deanei TaxID=59799 RepID=A0A7G2CBQ5_9TRYP|nr:tRNA pseudouridine38-40 synthase [Angomonas deanei]CAD2216949.1 tRNA pseudouridine synthase, putative [Angomonas deanei]|eukprot:EPY20244.1 tRNA pseudouridine38-40 synthase [Angomonas deanei]
MANVEQKEVEEAPPTPVIEGCQQYRYYKVPDGMKRLRSKRKVAIVFGYVGERYCGLQWNHRPEYPTIEEALLKALYETDMISLANISTRKVQQLIGFERASRTDKGVHALRNVVSVNLMLPYSEEYAQKYLAQRAAGEGEKDTSKENEDAGMMFSCEAAKALLNKALPSDIHVYDIVPVTQSFNAYLNCEGRRYEYYLPTFALMGSEEYQKHYFPPSLAPSYPGPEDVDHREGGLIAITRTETDGPTKKSKAPKKKGHFPRRKRPRTDDEEEAKRKADEEEEENNEEEEATADGEAPPPKETMFLFCTIAEEAMRRTAQYRIKEEQLNYVRELFHAYEGTHSFHNFTPGSRDVASAHRFIKQITVSEPFVVQPDDPTLLETVQYWTPSRFFAPDDVLANTFSKRAEKPQVEVKESGTGLVTAAGLTAQFTESEEEELRENMRRKMKRVYADGIEVVRIELHGQSFMLNQIRKMIGAVVCLTASGLPKSYLQETLLGKGIRRGIPMAPANGLFLSYLDFTGYGRRLVRIQQEGRNGANKRQLDVEQVDEAELEKQRRFIINVILRNEMVEDMMGKWMRSLRHVVRLSWQKDIP